MDIRKNTAMYMRNNIDDFIPFFSSTHDGDLCSPGEFSFSLLLPPLFKNICLVEYYQKSGLSLSLISICLLRTISKVL